MVLNFAPHHLPVRQDYPCSCCASFQWMQAISWAAEEHPFSSIQWYRDRMSSAGEKCAQASKSTIPGSKRTILHHASQKGVYISLKSSSSSSSSSSSVGNVCRHGNLTTNHPPHFCFCLPLAIVRHKIEKAPKKTRSLSASLSARWFHDAWAWGFFVNLWLVEFVDFPWGKTSPNKRATEVFERENSWNIIITSSRHGEISPASHVWLSQSGGAGIEPFADGSWLYKCLAPQVWVILELDKIGKKQTSSNFLGPFQVGFELLHRKEVNWLLRSASFVGEPFRVYP